MSNTCNTDATNRKRAFSAKCLPGQILFEQFTELSLVLPRSHLKITHLLPKPNAIVLGSLTSGFSLPSLMKRSGMKESGSGYVSGSWRSPLNEEESDQCRKGIQEKYDDTID